MENQEQQEGKQNDGLIPNDQIKGSDSDYNKNPNRPDSTDPYQQGGQDDDDNEDRAEDTGEEENDLNSDPSEFDIDESTGDTPMR